MKLSKITKYALCAALVVMFASCAQNEKTETNAKPATSEKAEASDLMNIRYICLLYTSPSPRDRG